MPSKATDKRTITLTGEDGAAYACRTLGVFDFENKQYALLLKMDGESAGQRPTTVIMQLIEKGDQAVFRTIEDDGEFERVMAYIKSIAVEMDGSS